MNTARPDKSNRAPTELSLDPALVDEARKLGLDLSQAAERGLADAIAEEAARRWRAENAEAVAGYNAYVQQNGLPLAASRLF
jgi:antitoxin CcdA